MSWVRLDPAPLVVSTAVLTPLGTEIASIVETSDTPSRKTIPADLEALTGASPLRFRRMDRYAALGFAAVHRAIERAGAKPETAGDPEWGILLGSSTGCWASNAQFFQDLARRATSELSPALFARTVSNAVNGEISIARQIGGVNQTYVSGWTAGAEAIAEAGALLSEGKAQWIVAGGIEAPDETLLGMHAAAGRERGAEWIPLAIAEGAGAVVLASPACAPEKDGLRLRAYVRVHDPRGIRGLENILEDLGSESIGCIVLANSVPPAILERFGRAARSAAHIVLPERTGEIGAAGAPVAVALAEHLLRSALHRAGEIVVISRGLEGGLVALRFSPGAPA